MDRFQYYQKKIGTKLLLSKFVYPTEKKMITFRRVIISAFPKSRDPEMASFGLAALFSRFPTFATSQDLKEKRQILRQISLTARNNRLLKDLHSLVNVVIPFQIENQNYLVQLSKQNEITLSFKKCGVPNYYNYIFFKYPISDDTFDLSAQLQFSNNSATEILYYARLFQLPVFKATKRKKL